MKYRGRRWYDKLLDHDGDPHLLYLILFWAVIFATGLILGGCSAKGVQSTSYTSVDTEPVKMIVADCHNEETIEFIKACTEEVP